MTPRTLPADERVLIRRSVPLEMFVTQGTASESPSTALDSPLLVCMLPVRDAERDLPGYLENVSMFCDAVVALDDGSTDGTSDLLAAHPLVKILVRNPPRDGFREWNDADNRKRLLEAAQELNPQWLIALDADERIDERDAAALREFLQTDALPGFVYGFRHVPMCEDGSRFRPKYLWYYRVFASMPGQRLPNHRLHFVPVPTNIPRQRWIKTTMRIQHLGELSAARRLARFAKYLEADPSQVYEMDYSRILEPIPEADLRRWRPRPQSMPILLAGAGIADDDDVDVGTGDEPVVSVIVLAVEGAQDVVRAVSSAVAQELDEPFEVIVVAGRGSAEATAVRQTFPAVAVVEEDASSSAGSVRNRALDIARGKVVVLMDARTELLPGNLAARLEAHRRGYAMVIGAAHNGSPKPAAWAWHFLEHVDELPGLPAGEPAALPGRCSYGRLPLFEVGDFTDWQGVDVEDLANRAIVNRTYFAVREPRAEQIVRPHVEDIPRLLWQQFLRGREQGKLIVDRHRQSGRLLTRRYVVENLLEAVPRRLREIEATLSDADGSYQRSYAEHRWLVALGATARVLGEWCEVVRPERGKLAILFDRPVLTALVALEGDEGRSLLAHVDLVSGETAFREIDQRIGSLLGDNGLLAMGSVRKAIEMTGALPKTLAAEAVEKGQLDVVVLEDGGLMRTGAAGNGIVEAAMMLFDVARALKRGRIRTTLTVWQTALVLRRIGNRLSREA